ncbi:DUF1983 domain-containing protein [Pectobacterium brasiliense]|nr:DUF1983 domain-containing protein [Pectobacterium brasiliense]WJM83458.1 DUF1983 domain-containing protein [Pectobacterium brasiliense]
MAWAPATDKAATDAQAAANAASNAAAAAQSTANGAVQSVNSVSATVTQQGNTIAAQGTQINTLTATVNGVSAEISDVSSVVGGMDAKMSAYRSIKVAVDANGRQYIAGIGLDVSNSQTGMQANIIMLADRFTMMTNAGGVPTAIFTNQGEQVILRDVVIGTATIDGTKIKNATITGAHIQDLSVDFAKITDTLKSSNYVSGQSGWSLPKSGNAELNNVTVRGTVYASAGRFEGTVFANKIEGDVTNSIVAPGRSITNSEVRYNIKYIGRPEREVSVSIDCLIANVVPTSVPGNGTLQVSLYINGSVKWSRTERSWSNQTIDQSRNQLIFSVSTPASGSEDLDIMLIYKSLNLTSDILPHRITISPINQGNFVSN